MDKNRIRGIHGRTSEQPITKSISIKGHGCRFGGCAVKAVGLTPGGLGVVSPDARETGGNREGPRTDPRSQQRA
jgi:hypothetical protein